MCCIIPNPVTGRIAIESQRFRDSAKPIREAAEESRHLAPIPIAAIRNPSVCGPPCRISEAKIGISTLYGIPTGSGRI